MLISQALALFVGAVGSVSAKQQPLTGPAHQKPQTQQKDTGKPALRKLQGRFLHITDIHPDGFYEPYSSVESACHSGNGTAGILGTEMSDCDTPFTLVNATFQWINDNLKDHIDFVIWTGDSARHDNDENIPRTEDQIVDLNKMVVEKFVQVFGKDDNIDDPDPTNDFIVPIVPTFGNNDILPHNIFEPGPNRWTKDYAEIWRNLIPEAQRHSFARGGWFFNEVIPNKLAVFSLNTIYFFDSNSAVNGCDDESEPGYEHMEWLRVQLEFLREKGMKAIMIGHVPPARTASKQSWDESCWQKYSLWMRQYRDVVVTGIFGHMNIDHFMIHDALELNYHPLARVDSPDVKKREATGPQFSTLSKTEYLTDLREEWANLPSPPSDVSYMEILTTSDIEDAMEMSMKSKTQHQEEKKKFFREIGGEWAERFSLSLVSPSVVPNYFPTLRVVEYNITGMENEHPAVGNSRPAAMKSDVEHVQTTKRRKRKKVKNPSKPPFEMPRPPSSTSPPGPAYSPQPFSLTSYTQYFANLTFIKDDLEKSGIPLDEYIGTRTSSVPNPRKFAYQVEYDTKTDKRYQLGDMTMRSYVSLAHRIAKEAKMSYHTGWQVLNALPDEPVAEIGDTDIGTKDWEGVEENDEQIEIKEEVNAETKHKKKNKKKHRKKHRKKKGNGKKEDGKELLWHTFVKRAFVMTKSDEDMDDFDP